MKDRVVLGLSLFLVLILAGTAKAQKPGWKGAVVRQRITPEKSIWMAGFAARTRPSEGTLHDIWIKALLLEDANGKRAVLITSDLLGFPKQLSDRIRDKIQHKFGLTRDQVLLNSSHTHSGPVLGLALQDIYPMNDGNKKDVVEFTTGLEDHVVNLVGKAIASLRPVRVSSSNGVTRFQVNRRNNKESALVNQHELKGPNDFAVPVLKVVDVQNRMIAVAFGYACHPTVLDLYQWSGDYPGFAQIELEKKFPGTTALFFQCAGADQNPLPRRTIPLAVQYGQELVAAVSRVLDEPMKSLDPDLSTGYIEVELPIEQPASDEELNKIIKENGGFYARWAERILRLKEAKYQFPSTYSYPLQVWKIGGQPLFALGGELTVQYALDLKAIFGPEIFVLGYSNDVMTYIPSETILKEGGYEGAQAHMVYGLAGKWKPGIQARIVQAMKELALKTGVTEK